MKFSDIELPSNRKFGFFFTAVFAVLGAYFLYMEATTTGAALFLLTAIFLIITLLNDAFLLPLNRLWMRLGYLLGMVVSPIVLGLIFFVIFTPMSLLMRLFGRDELRLTLKDRSSHWKERSSDTRQTVTFKYQF